MKSAMFACSLALATSASAQFSMVNAAPMVPHYSIQVFDPHLPGIMAVPSGISQNGKITGYAIDQDSIFHVFIWQSGVYQDLGPFGYESAAGQAVNNSGQIAATGYTPGWHAVRYTNGVVKTIGSIDGGNSYPIAMNNRGDIVGVGVNGDGGSQGFTYINNKMTAIAVDRCNDINDNQVFVGAWVYTWTLGHYMYGVDHPFKSTAGGPLVDLGDLGGGPRSEGKALGINNAGQITGYSTTAFYQLHAFLWSSGVMQDIGTIGNFIAMGTCITNNGVILGALCQGNIYNQVGSFIYKDGQMYELSQFLGPAAKDWSNLIATKMNDAGVIVGYGTYKGNQVGFVAQPGLMAAPAIKE